MGCFIYIYAFNHNPPHIHVKSPNGDFTITIKDSIVERKARMKDLKIINAFLDLHQEEVMEIWEKAQRSEATIKIK